MHPRPCNTNASMPSERGLYFGERGWQSMPIQDAQNIIWRRSWVWLYARTTPLVINAFGLESTGRTCPINTSTLIDAANVTKIFCIHLVGSKWVIQKSAIHWSQWDHSLLMNIACVIFSLKAQFYSNEDCSNKGNKGILSSIWWYIPIYCNIQDHINDPKNLEKFHWRQLEDLEPLNITRRQTWPQIGN